MKKQICLLSLVTFIIIFAVACSGDEEASKSDSSGDKLTWASGAQGGGWYTTAGGISSLILDETGIDIGTIPGGSMQNMPFVSDNEAQLAWMQPPFIQAGLNGDSPFEEEYDDVSIIGNG